MVVADQLFVLDEACRQTYPRETLSAELHSDDIDVSFGIYLAMRPNPLSWAKSRHASDAAAVLMDELVTNEQNVHVGDHLSTRVAAVEEDRHHYSKSRTSSSVDVCEMKAVAPRQNPGYERLSFSIVAELEPPMPARLFVSVRDFENLSENQIEYSNRFQTSGRDNPSLRGYNVFDGDEFRLQCR